jgi:CRP-like cAMP-binding protein
MKTMDYRAIFEDWADLLDFTAGETIYGEGDPAVALFFVLDGEVELKRHDVMTGVENPGGIIGESALLGVETRSGKAVARTDTRLARLDRDQLKQLMDGDTEFALLVMAALAKRLRAVDAFIGAHLIGGSGD